MFKKKNEEKDLVSPDYASLYINNMKRLYSIVGLKLDDNDKEVLTNEYNTALDYFKNYMEAHFSDEILVNENSLSINEEDMLANATDATKRLFLKPLFSSLIYINKDNSYAHMHTDGCNVTEMEGMESIKGLNPLLAKRKINNIFNGLSIVEAGALLQQMSLLEKESELREEIEKNSIRENIRSMFFKCIIYRILDSNSPQRITRARLFADSYNVPFDFTGYEEKVEHKLVKSPDNIW